MRRSNYERSGSRRTQHSAILIIALVLLFAVIVGGTVALLQATAANRLTNTFAPVKVEIDPDEEKTPTSKSNIKFQNTGDVPVYIRATLVIYWKDSDENFVPQPAGGKIEGGLIQDGWTEKNGIYYYGSQVAPQDWTGVMLSEIVVTCPDGYTCHIDVQAEAIQAEGLNASSAQDAWEKAKEGQK